jgi:hypothetical protein
MKKSPPLKGGHLLLFVSFALGARAARASLAGEDVAMAVVVVVVATVNARSRLTSLVATLIILFVVWVESGGCGGKQIRYAA